MLYNLLRTQYIGLILEKRALKEKVILYQIIKLWIEQKTDTNIWVYDSGLVFLKNGTPFIWKRSQEKKMTEEAWVCIL